MTVDYRDNYKARAARSLEKRRRRKLRGRLARMLCTMAGHKTDDVVIRPVGPGSRYTYQTKMPKWQDYIKQAHDMLEKTGWQELNEDGD